MWSDENPPSGYTDTKASFGSISLVANKLNEHQQGEQLARRRRARAATGLDRLTNDHNWFCRFINGRMPHSARQVATLLRSDQYAPARAR
jgi:hypothetical protein